MATPQTICAERTVTLTRRSILNPLRKLAKRPLPTYTAHLFADAVVIPAPGSHLPTLDIEQVGDGHVRAVVTWANTSGGVIARLSVRERGANRPWRAKPARQVCAAVVQLRTSEVQLSADRLRIFNPGPGADGVERSHAMEVDGGAVRMVGSVVARAGGQVAGLRMVSETTGPVDVALPRRMAAMFAEGVMPSPLPGAPTPPTESTTVLHDLAFIVDQLETAQFQVALSPGGADAGSVDNAAHLALCAVQLMQAKLEVAAEAADLATQQVMEAQARAEGSLVTGELKQSLNRSAAMLRQVTTRLPLKPTESPHVRF